MSRTYRVGIVGSGFGVRAHLPAFAGHDRFEVVALASPNTAKQAAGERNIPHAFESCEAMLRGVELDVVSVAAPPFTHEADVLASLAAGKHVICEKPFALSVAQAARMRDAARAAGTACAVMHEFRWVPERQALKELVANGHLENVREVEIAQLSTFLNADARRSRGWWFERERGGGLAGALLSHIIDSATWLVGRPPIGSSGMLRTALPQRNDERGTFTSSVDDGCFALVDYGDGLIGRLACDATVSVESFTVALHGADRTAVSSGVTATENRLFIVEGDETSELDCAKSRYAHFESAGANVPFIMDLLDEYVKALEGKPSAVPTFDEAVETQKVLASIGYGT